jgi:hypothetical protein
VRILHISDLHITRPHRNLEQVWNGPHGALRDDLFDYIVVSGDLSQRATEKEYKELCSFAKDTLSKRLKLRVDESVPDLARIVFVPGNHDVDWKADVYEPVNIATLGDDWYEQLQSHVTTLRKEPETGDLRMFISDVAHFGMLRIKPAEYAKRFTNVQAFFVEFYQNTAAADGILRREHCRPFNLLDSSGDGDWSAHVFPADNVAFVGLSSCARNDKYWHGARFDERAIASVRNHIEKLRRSFPDMLFVAVWHHGFASDVGRPDRLTLNDIGTLYNIGIRLGFHGHTHIDELQYHDLLSGRLVIVATGSLGAGDGELPRGTDNQFSVVDVYPSRVDIKRYELTRKNVFEHTSESLPLVRRSEGGAGPVSRAERHKRSFRVNKDGIVEVVVKLTGIQALGSLPLAIVSPPFCNVSHRRAKTNLGQVEVHKTELPDGRIRYWLVVADGIKSCEWSYHVSNTVALTQSELALLPSRQPWYTNIGPNEDARSHTVRLDCDDLEIGVTFEAGIPHVSSARALVERRQSDGQDSYWEMDELETARAASAFMLDAGQGEMILRVTAPIREHRYSIVFTPTNASPEYPLRAKQLGRRLVEACRNDTYGASRLRDHISSTVGRVLSNVLTSSFAPIGAWSGFLWHQEKRKLFAAFGEFPAKSWASRFAAGAGVVGHAFRHSCPVGWVNPGQRHEPGRENTIFQEIPEHYEGDPFRYEWVLNIPLWLETSGPSIGVVGFAREHSTTEVDYKLRALAEDISSAPEGVSESNKALLVKLERQINAAFWIALAKADKDDLTQEFREYAAQRLVVLGALETSKE